VLALAQYAVLGRLSGILYLEPTLCAYLQNEGGKQEKGRPSISPSTHINSIGKEADTLMIRPKNGKISCGSSRGTRQSPGPRRVGSPLEICSTSEEYTPDKIASLINDSDSFRAPGLCHVNLRSHETWDFLLSTPTISDPAASQECCQQSGKYSGRWAGTGYESTSH